MSLFSLNLQPSGGNKQGTRIITDKQAKECDRTECCKKEKCTVSLGQARAGLMGA